MATNDQKPIIRIIRILIALALALTLQEFTGTPAQAQIPQSSCFEIWDYPVTVADSNGKNTTLILGQGLFATNGLDLDCDTQLPPPPPTGAFDARLSNGTTDFSVDYRLANLPGTITWQLKFQPSSGASNITISWNPASLPGAGTWTLRDSFGGVLVNADMRITSSLVVNNFALSPLNIIYQTSRCTVTAIASGDWTSTSTWNTNCTGIPAATDDVYIPGGLAVNFNAGSSTIESLTLGSGAGLSFSNSNPLAVSDNAFIRGGTLNLGSLGNLSVNGALTNLGIMQQTKTVTTTGIEAVEASQTFLNLGGYGGLVLTTSATSLGSTTVKIKGGQICDTDNTSVWRCFTITPTNNAVDVNVDFYFAQNELNGSDCNSLQAWRFTGGQSWVSAGGLNSRSCAVEPYVLSYNGVTLQNTGSYFNLRSGSSPTAIRLQSFNSTRFSGSGFLMILLVGLFALSLYFGLISQKLRWKNES